MKSLAYWSANKLRRTAAKAAALAVTYGPDAMKHRRAYALCMRELARRRALCAATLQRVLVEW